MLTHQQREDLPYRRPENVPDMPTECSVCLEPLFNSEGIVIDEEHSVAKIMCPHLFHSKCLVKVAKALNADGERYGIGGIGSIRAGCPICSRGVSFWMCHDEAAAFPIFWMHRIQSCLESIGPNNGPIPVTTIKEMIEQNDTNLTIAQKKYLHQNEQENLGFTEAVSNGAYVWVHEFTDGGPENGGTISRSYSAEGVWDWDRENKTLWLPKWGKPIINNKQQQQQQQQQTGFKNRKDT